MGHTIWVEVHGRPLNETADDSSIMHRLDRELDALAARLNVPKLTDFYDYSELEEAYREFDPEAEAADDDDDDGDAEGAEDPAEPTLEGRQAKGEWFDSNQGLTSVRALRAHLREDFDALGFKPDESRAHWPRQLMQELAKCETILMDAAARGKQFRLLIVP
jgi:hypothetical protein